MSYPDTDHENTLKLMPDDAIVSRYLSFMLVYRHLIAYGYGEIPVYKPIMQDIRYGMDDCFNELVIFRRIHTSNAEEDEGLNYSFWEKVSDWLDANRDWYLTDYLSQFIDPISILAHGD